KLAGIETDAFAARWLLRSAFIFLTLMVVSAPHSIAATQISWIIGTLIWFASFFFRPRKQVKFRPLNIALFAFFAWSIVSGLFSYEPSVSLDRLRSVAVFLIFIFAAANIRRLGAAYFLAFALIVSCMVNVVWTPVHRMMGRGVEIHGLKPESPLAKALLWEGDTLLTANGKKVKTSQDVAAAIAANEVTKIKFYRPDFEFAVDVKRSDMLAGTTANEQLGIERWSLSHNWRSMGFYNHYVTYSEVLMLVASLIFGLLIAAIGSYARRRRSTIPLLAAAFAGTSFALLLTVTRASQLALMISAFMIVLRGASRKIAIATVLLAIPVIIGGLFFLQQSRQTGFFDSKDESTRYRFVMWNDGGRLLTAGPRNFVFGVGMDSIQKHWQEWGMYEGGFLPMGHFHSAPVQIAVERGIPALLIWLIILALFARTLWRGITIARDGDWRSFGILLGTFGALVGFVASGFVHWNLGDQEVAMVFYILMAFGVRTAELNAADPDN
ncbi:MAG: O-antigen ligase family protein, partial [Pyrinomonadaceae bacterium]|nr:O-antigen ligase family protein [Pyrinomonadaceae bacterium]